ncbi:hypothetical protein SAMN04487792_0407 [Lactobacillus bombicola]|uniref:Uncharacterized protein n=1 Tax=Lactobacillus bombicola TaxID=1505723 RepID=A0A1I1RS02_9LACO|nr:hypothetical protein [Lactobacillus bombicola]SFD35018.1 hypothetical protein SAMN04487792_0407 [Lactobacillus bombicola]
MKNIDMNKLDDKFIQVARESNNLYKGLCILFDKIREIESPEDLTLDQLNQISSLTEIIKSYAKSHNDFIDNAY